IGGSGGISEFQELISIGWDDIWAAMFGIEYQANPKVTVRGGLNFNDSPIREDVTLNSGGTPPCRPRISITERPTFNNART
ncbi:MAG: hypothetical protein GY838_09900, partial [bacterium]|nr:hypothetical protein [bacterium]